MLKLEKQKVATLTASEMDHIHGGGLARSNRRTGNCAYSREHPYTVMCCGEPQVLGCRVARASANTPTQS
ncbi:MAG: hypothetical protein ACFB10_20740 [Salibacteraceae bacterium]